MKTKSSLLSELVNQVSSPQICDSSHMTWLESSVSANRRRPLSVFGFVSMAILVGILLLAFKHVMSSPPQVLFHRSTHSHTLLTWPTPSSSTSSASLLNFTQPSQHAVVGCETTSDPSTHINPHFLLSAYFRLLTVSPSPPWNKYLMSVWLFPSPLHIQNEPQPSACVFCSFKQPLKRTAIIERKKKKLTSSSLWSRGTTWPDV